MFALALNAMAADRVLVVTATAGFRHDSIPTAEQVIAGIADETRWFDVVFARTEGEMAQALTPEALRGVKVVIFANTSGELAVPTRDALLQWVAGGGSFIGAHSASDTWHDWPEYIDMLGGEFESHPPQFTATVIVGDRSHPSTRTLDTPHVMFEEIYTFKNFAGANVTTLVSLDNGQPLSWYRTYGAGRVFYTALGHRSDVWTSEWYRQHLAGAIEWALRREGRARRRGMR